MAYRKTPSYLWRHSSGCWFLKRPIPPELQHHYPDPKTGKPRTHITQSLKTHNRAEAEQLKRAPLRLIEAEFARLAPGRIGGRIGDANEHHERLTALRQNMAEVWEAGGDEGTEAAIEDLAEQIAERVQAEQGREAASMAYTLATQPDKLTLREALAARHKGATTREQTKAAEVKALEDLLAFLQVPDCLPKDVTPKMVDAYVDALNDGKLSHATKKGRLSCLGRLWGMKKVKVQLAQGAPNPWRDHDVKGERKSTEEVDEDGEKGRNWTAAEMVKVLSAPEPTDKRQRTYTRGLFKELHAVGFITGMRLDEITSLRPVDVTPMPWGVVVNIRKSKTKAGLRSLPVVHPAAVAILKGRAEAQADPKGMLFHECVPGGPDNKTSWHVSKAMGKDRDRLGLHQVTFHGTRGTFMRLQENARTDHIIVQRYVGHVIGTLMHDRYSDGPEVDTLRIVSDAVRWPEEVEASLRGT